MMGQNAKFGFFVVVTFDTIADVLVYFFFSDWDSLLNQPEVWLGNVFRKYKLAEKALRKLRFV